MLIQLFKRGGFVTLICGLMAVVFALLAQDAHTTGQALADHGQSAIATVVDKHRETEERRTGSSNHRTTDTDYYLTYAFEAAPAGPQRVETLVPKGLYDDLTVGDEAEIRYLPEDPTRIEVYPGQMASTGTVMGVVAGVLGLAAAIAAVVAVKLTRQSRPLPQMS